MSTELFLSIETMNEYLNYLEKEERSEATLEKYRRDMKHFYQFLGEDKSIRKERLIEYKKHLAEEYQLSSSNSMLAAVNGMLRWMGLESCRVKSFKTQRKIFSDDSRELNKEEYERLLKTAETRGNERLALILQTLGGTGIRIGELSYITAEAILKGQAIVTGKGKQRIVFIMPKLRKYLLKYCRKRNITAGPVFITRSGKPLHRSNIWAEMKRLCTDAGVNRDKVFPHNLRHLFARICYKKKKDIVYLADLLGHSSIETTRIYTMSSGNEHKQLLESLGLVI